MTPTKVIQYSMIAILSVAFSAQALAYEPQPYLAEYDLYRNGKLTAKTVITLEVQGELLNYTSDSKGIKGLARFLGASDYEYSELHWKDQTLTPLQYRHQSKVAGRKKQWSAVFDWQADQVDTETKEGQFQLTLQQGDLDPLSLTLAMAQKLASDDQQWQFRLVDEDEIDQHLYERRIPQQLETALGCFSVQGSHRIRENSKRYTRAWYAPALNLVPVLIEHGKTGDSALELRLTSLTLNGVVIENGQQCQS